MNIPVWIVVIYLLFGLGYGLSRATGNVITFPLRAIFIALLWPFFLGNDLHSFMEK